MVIEHGAIGNLRQELHKIHNKHAVKKAMGKGQLDNYVVYGSSFFDYQADFTVVSDEIGLDNFISTRSPLVVLDLMSPANTLREIFAFLPREKSKLGIAVSLEDLRTDEAISLDNRLGVRQIEGDLTYDSTWRQIYEVLEGRKVDLILERGKGGLNGIPLNKLFYAMVARRLWNLLGDGGMLLAELPPPWLLRMYNIPVYEWVTFLSEKGISIRYTGLPDDPCYSTAHMCYLRLTKTLGSPKVLPLF